LCRLTVIRYTYISLLSFKTGQAGSLFWTKKAADEEEGPFVRGSKIDWVRPYYVERGRPL